MVDMVEARKRAKSKMSTATAAVEIPRENAGQVLLPGESKPVLRSESPEASPTYFPVEPVETEIQPKRTQPLILAPEAVPAEVVPDEQIDSLHRLLNDEGGRTGWAIEEGAA